MFWRVTAIDRNTGKKIRLVIQAEGYSEEDILGILQEVHSEWEDTQLSKCPEDWRPEGSYYQDDDLTPAKKKASA